MDVWLVRVTAPSAVLGSGLFGFHIGFVRAPAETPESRFQKAHAGQDGDREDRQRQRFGRTANANGAPDRREHPDNGGRGHPGDGSAPRQDDARAEEPNAHDHLTEHPRRIDPGAAQDDAQSDEDLRGNADEDTGPDSNRFAPELALEADDAAADDAGRQLQGKRKVEPVEHSREVFHVLTYGQDRSYPQPYQRSGSAYHDWNRWKETAAGQP